MDKPKINIKVNCHVLSKQMNCFRLKFCNCCLWIWRLSTLLVTSSYVVLMIQATLPLRHYTAHLIHWPSEPLQKKWVLLEITTISDNGQHCKEHIITKYVVRRNSRWITSGCLSLMTEKNYSSHSEFILPGVSHQVSAQEDICFGRWCLKNSRMAVQCWTLFDILMKWFQIFCVTYQPTASHQVSAEEDIWFERWWCLKNSRMAV